MKAKDLFIIILKVLGIYMLKDVLLTIPPVLSDFLYFMRESGEFAIFSLIVSLLNSGVHIAIVYVLIFKTGFIISKLKLTAGLGEEPMVWNMHRSSIYSIAIIVSGLIILVFSIPDLVRHLYKWAEYIDSRKELAVSQSFNFSGLLIAATEVIIGLLFLGNQRLIINFIEARRQSSGAD